MELGKVRHSLTTLDLNTCDVKNVYDLSHQKGTIVAEVNISEKISF